MNDKDTQYATRRDLFLVLTFLVASTAFWKSAVHIGLLRTRIQSLEAQVQSLTNKP